MGKKKQQMKGTPQDELKEVLKQETSETTSNDQIHQKEKELCDELKKSSSEYSGLVTSVLKENFIKSRIVDKINVWIRSVNLEEKHTKKHLTIKIERGYRARELSFLIDIFGPISCMTLMNVVENGTGYIADTLIPNPDGYSCLTMSKLDFIEWHEYRFNFTETEQFSKNDSLEKITSAISNRIKIINDVLKATALKLSTVVSIEL